MNAQEPCRFRIGKGRKVHHGRKVGAIDMHEMACGLLGYRFGWGEGVGRRLETTDPVDCKTCLRVLAARDGS